METKQHIFTDLGKAPYKLIGFRVAESYDPEDEAFGIMERVRVSGPTTCDHCGTYITNIFECKSSDNKKFVLGSSCVEKLGDEGLTQAVKTKISELRREKRQAKAMAEWEAALPQRMADKAEQDAKEKAETDRRNAEYDRVKPLLAKRPHPNAFFASKGKTMLDYVEYCGRGSFAGQRAIREAGGNV